MKTLKLTIEFDEAQSKKIKTHLESYFRTKLSDDQAQQKLEIIFGRTIFSPLVSDRVVGNLLCLDEDRRINDAIERQDPGFEFEIE